MLAELGPRATLCWIRASIQAQHLDTGSGITDHFSPFPFCADMRAPEHSLRARQSSGRKIALNFLPFREQDFAFAIYRRKLKTTDQAVPGTRWLPIDCMAENKGDSEKFRYVVSLTKDDGYQETSIRAWVNPGLTVHVLYEALMARTREDDLAENFELPDKEFLREVGFVLKRHGDAREMMSLRPFELRRTGTSACCANSHFVSLPHHRYRKRPALN